VRVAQEEARSGREAHGPWGVMISESRTVERPPPEPGDFLDLAWEVLEPTA
jgi:hypothetical protein